MNENPTINPQTLPPLTKFIYTIGALPTSYLMSMTYEEQLVWLCNYLGKEVIPAINTNGEAVEELQKLYEDLQDYVNNYFDDLDIQTEVDNKIDAMYEAGTLQEIITEYLQVSGVLGFDTVSSMSGATNLIDGSICRTLGETSYNDGKGAFYKVRILINTDVIDGDNLVALTNYPTLVAEKMPDYRLNQLEHYVDLNTNKKYLLIGDSYATGYQGEGIPAIEGFFTKVVNDLGLTAQIVAANAYGFAGMGDNHKWLTLLQNTTINNKDTFTDIIICGGMNDQTLATTLEYNMNELFTYLRTNFINATIHVGMIGKYRWNSSVTSLVNIKKTIKNYKRYCTKYGVKFIDNSNNILHNTRYFISDNIHMNENGEKQLAYCIEQYIINGKINDISNVESEEIVQTDTFVPASGVTWSSTFFSSISNNTASLYFQGNFNLDPSITMNNLDTITLGQLTNSYITGSANFAGIDTLIDGYVYANDNNAYKVTFRIFNDENNNLKLKVFSVRDNGGYPALTISLISFPYGVVKLDAINDMS